MPFSDEARADAAAGRAPASSTAEVTTETLRDATSLASSLTQAGFYVAQRSMDVGFGVPAAMWNWAGDAAPLGTGAPFFAVAGGIEAVHGLVDGIVGVYGAGVPAALNAAEAGMDVGGVRGGRSFDRGVRHARSKGWLFRDGEETMRALGRVFMMVSNFLKEEATDITHLVRGLPLVKRFHSERSVRLHDGERHRAIPHTSLDHVDLSEKCRLAVASYGHAALKVMGIVPLGTDVSTDEDALRSLCPYVEKVLHHQSEMDGVYCPGHFLAIGKTSSDDDDRALYVSIRGTMRASDVLADLVCHHEPFTELGENAQAHGGMLVSARRLDAVLRPLVTEQLALHQHGAPRITQIVIAGHSLGAGTATLLAALWSRAPFMANAHVALRAYAFAPPCVLDARASHSVDGVVTSVVLKHDFVARFGLESTRELRDLAVACSRAGVETYAAFEEVAAQVAQARAGLKLYPGGRIVVVRDDETGYLTHEPASHFDEIVLADDGIFAVHMPNAYVSALADVSAAVTRGTVVAGDAITAEPNAAPVETSTKP